MSYLLPFVVSSYAIGAVATANLLTFVEGAIGNSKLVPCSLR